MYIFIYMLKAGASWMQVERTGQHFPRHRGTRSVAMVALLMVAQLSRDISGF